MKCSLKELCLNITDGEHGSIKNNINGQYFLLSNKNIVDGRIVFSEKDRKISLDDYNKINKRCKLEQNDILISTVGSLGKTAIIKEKKCNYVFQRSVAIIKPNKKILDSYYLSYLLQTPHYQKKLINNSKGAVQKCIFLFDLKELMIKVPSISEQVKIVKLLKIIDRKIEVNNKINDNL